MKPPIYIEQADNDVMIGGVYMNVYIYGQLTGVLRQDSPIIKNIQKRADEIKITYSSAGCGPLSCYVQLDGVSIVYVANIAPCVLTADQQQEYLKRYQEFIRPHFFLERTQGRRKLRV